MLCRNSEIALRGTQPLIDHLAKMLTTLKHHDFMCLRQYNKNWAAQQEIPQERVINFLACLLHYNGRVGDVIRFASNNYTAEHRNIPERIKMLEGLVDPDLCWPGTFESRQWVHRQNSMQKQPETMPCSISHEATTHLSIKNQSGAQDNE